ncbi:hypothetical protein [Pseudomonas sp. NCCP-436]|uniref:hypothetical protein n=1 Tax=Pseudomonas sp. NCCP-436 TaxID=2842481 RepID=UPI001C80B3E1|nr:hypothetical protein [Pseudomonas sp. NCCP-436]GIZ13153.1 hypothetical protein NCCP436_25690 [Pseudomonas sp. NCCP-436]
MSIVRLNLFCAVALCSCGAFAAQSVETVAACAVTGEFNASGQAMGGYAVGDDTHKVRPRTAEVLDEEGGWVNASELQPHTHGAEAAQPLANSPRWVF